MNEDTNETTVEGAIAEAQAAPEYSLLKVWAEILSNIEAIRDQEVPMFVAHKITAAWPQIRMQETPAYHDRYHALLLEMREVLHDVIQENPGCTDHIGEVDAVENLELYRNLVIAWNVILDQHELEWKPTDEDSHITFAALVDVRAFLFGRNGFAGHLESRGITFPSDEIADAIAAAREQEEQSE